MKFSKLVWRNIKTTISHYIIYWLFNVIIFFLLYSGNFIGNSFIDITVSNSLPAIIITVASIVLVYTNKCIVGRRGKEFAIYMLIGLNRQKLVSIYVFENLGILLLSFVAGVPLGVLYCYFVLSSKIGMESLNNVVLVTLGATIGYFILLCIIAIIISIYLLHKKNLKNLFTMRYKSEENRSINIFNVIREIVICTFLIVIFSSMLNKIENMLPFISVVGIILVYTLIKLSLDSLSYIRKKNLWLIKKNKIYIIAKLLSKYKNKLMMYGVLNICFIISICSFIVGYIFKNSQSIIIQYELDIAMGHIQTYIAFLFLITLCFVSSLSQSMDILDSKEDYYKLMYIGQSRKAVSKVLLGELCLNGVLSIGGGVFVILLSSQVVNIVEGMEALNKYMVLSIIVYIFFILVLYNSIKRLIVI